MTLNFPFPSTFPTGWDYLPCVCLLHTGDRAQSLVHRRQIPYQLRHTQFSASVFLRRETISTCWGNSQYLQWSPVLPVFSPLMLYSHMEKDRIFLKSWIDFWRGAPLNTPLCFLFPAQWMAMWLSSVWALGWAELPWEAMSLHPDGELFSRGSS